MIATIAILSAASLIVMVGLGPTIHEFREAKILHRQTNSWMGVPSTTMTREKRS